MKLRGDNVARHSRAGAQGGQFRSQGAMRCQVVIERLAIIVSVAAENALK
jgi:hypothetical protein